MLSKFRVDRPFVYQSSGKYNIVNSPGLHEESGVYLDPKNYIDVEPFDNIEQADFVLSELFGKIPYDSGSSLCNTIGQIISGCMRFSMPAGNTPITITVSRSTNETDLVHSILYGTPVYWHSDFYSLQEYRKILFQSILQSHGMACFNVDKICYNRHIESMASISMARAFSNRILYSNEIKTVDNYLQVCIVVDDLDVTQEIQDKTILKVVNEQEQFEFATKEEFLEKREFVLRAIFTYIDRWIEKGCPLSEEKAKTHRHKSWCKTIGGILLDTVWYDKFMKY